MGAAERIERERLEKVVEEGLRIKAEMAAQGAEARGLRQQEIQTKKVDLETLHADKEAKKVIKDEKERFEKEALDVIREEEDRLRQVKEEQERKDKEAEALSYFAKLDKNGDGYITKDELIFEIVLDQNNDGQVSDEEVNFYMSGHDNYDQETFLNTGWLLMKHLYPKLSGSVSNVHLPNNRRFSTTSSSSTTKTSTLVAAEIAARKLNSGADDPLTSSEISTQTIEETETNDDVQDLDDNEDDQVLDEKTKKILKKMVKNEVKLHVHHVRQSIDDVTGIVWQILSLLFAISIGK